MTFYDDEDWTLRDIESDMLEHGCIGAGCLNPAYDHLISECFTAADAERLYRESENV